MNENYENLPMQYTKNCLVVEIFHWKCFHIFLISAHNIDCGYTLEPHRQGGSNENHNLCFGAKIRKIGIPLHTPVLLYKSWVYGGIYFTDMFSLCLQQCKKQNLFIYTNFEIRLDVYIFCFKEMKKLSSDHNFLRDQ